MPTFRVSAIREMVGDIDASDADEAKEVVEGTFGDVSDFFAFFEPEVTSVEDVSDQY